MKIDRGLILAAGVAVAASACASAGGTGATAAGTAGTASSASFPQAACPGGQPAVTQYATAAQNALNRTMITRGDAARPFYTTAMEQARAGIAADAANPLHYYILGNAALGTNNFAAADSAFRRSLELCPQYAGEVNPLRQRAALTAFNEGVEAFNRQDTAAALAQWSTATQLYPAVPQAHLNQAIIYAGRNDYTRAAAAYRATLMAVDSARGDTTVADLAETRAGALGGLVSVGANLFQQNQFQQAADLFAAVHATDPNNRDAWYNHALALYKLERWQQLVPVATRVVQIDPLNYNARIILFNAYKGLSDAAKTARNTAVENTNRQLALTTLTEADQLPVQVDQVQLRLEEGSASITGQVRGANARPGTPIRLDFTFFGPTGPVGTQTVTVPAPAKDAATPFTATLATPSPVSGWSYRVGS
jgi:tetratricopeptide (TPR) repeat protein